ncbi:hypothetical protein BCIN_11g05000 [Botrytis cinerea B05.10]|uniref:Alpha-type protein kinase domain-containing protein n=2 Tax=Botryotinia fuckeliana TaxID=40559 RepID=A0A384JX85_BOTFB|nr:hypothetical protein BCIN_11g05000 [Botrytis cinerea B05.10]ATZ55219.1 hypothetical protein BCIN_11g05000 [Botrytis cinerea B05.10]EMR87739.1 putative elongation factor 2 protein [Botrytis cinerea BcDW1]
MREGFFDIADISRDEVSLDDAPDDLENSDFDDDMFAANMTLKLGTNSPDDLENPDSDDCLSIANMTLELGKHSPNDSTEATIYVDQVIGSGFFKNAYEGFYTNGERSGQRCVSKQFKTGFSYQDYQYRQQIEVEEKAKSIIDAFNATNTPSEWHSDLFDGGNTIPIYPVRFHPSTLCTNNETGAMSFIEPFIENYRKFNSALGQAPDDDEFAAPIQALSHFSYHISDGKMLLCDLQGGGDANGYTLADPAIASVGPQRLYGPSDMGPQAILTFFKNHVCEVYCNPQWLKLEVVERELLPIQRGLLPPYET